MDRSFRHLCFVVLPLCLVGCPSSSNDLGTPDVEGIWQGKFTAAGPAPSPATYLPGSYTLKGAIVKGYYGFLYDSEGDFFSLPAMDDTTSVSGIGTEYWTCGSGPGAGTYCNYGISNIGPDGGDYPFTATVGSDTIDASLTYVVMRNGSCGMYGLCTSVPGSTFNLRRNQPYSGTPHLFPGAWQGIYYGAAVGPNITVNSDGTFTGNDPLSCPISGTITQEGTSNLFAVTLTRPVICGSSDTDYLGAGYLVDTGTDVFAGVPGTYFVMGYSNHDWGHVVQFKVQ